MTVTHALQGLGIGQLCGRSAIQYHKIIAGTVHFAEPPGHQPLVPDVSGWLLGSGLTKAPLLPHAVSTKERTTKASNHFRPWIFMVPV
jgi:hypothetical protein